MGLSKRTLFYRLPPSLRFLARRLYYLPYDLRHKRQTQKGIPLPPKGLVYTGGGDFLEEGERILKFCQREGGLAPGHRVLDIGSGIGRLALPLTDFLDSTGSYAGFDVIQTGVRWCRDHIQSKFPNFQFQYIELKNDLYRSGGIQAEQFTFPYEDQSFDWVLVNSVFTHMIPEEVVQYLKEIERILKPGGYCYATFFVYDSTVKARIKQMDDFQFPYDYGHYRLMDDQVQSANVAYDWD
ncbi:MAG: class I SAM-dependent methyltransferase [Phaeodactylibacter sp.]|nr:class I SAM-dependent methyltransferase [Phaeodactylibacter sp.]